MLIMQKNQKGMLIIKKIKILNCKNICKQEITPEKKPLNLVCQKHEQRFKFLPENLGFPCRTKRPNIRSNRDGI